MSVVGGDGGGEVKAGGGVFREIVLSNNEGDVRKADTPGVVGNDEASIVNDEDSLVIDGCERGGVSKDEVDDDELMVSRTTCRNLASTKTIVELD